MASIEFYYNGSITAIQCNEKDKMKDIINRFQTKMQLEKEKLIFLYGGNKINEELTFEETINKDSKIAKKMKVLVLSNDQEVKKENGIILSKEIICPICRDNCFLNIENFKILLNGCKNRHKNDSLFINEFKKTQIVDEKNIKCSYCKKDKVTNQKFYLCNSCNKIFCLLCQNKYRSEHEQHNIINYDDKNYICNIHNSNYNFYCEDCKKDICNQCVKDHNNHKTLILANLMPSKEE